jgi:plastocyanin
MTKLSTVVAACCLAVALAACGGPSEHAERTTGTATAEATRAPAADGPTITISGMNFGSPLTVTPGTHITITNKDSVEHSVTSRAAGQFDVHVDGGEDGELKAPNSPGEYAFYCVYHPSMTGTLIVK